MQELPKTSGYIRKDYLDQIKQYLNPNLIKVIVGLRRSGKGVLILFSASFYVP
jgi:predicted AAA+ superfamily ATPase